MLVETETILNTITNTVNQVSDQTKRLFSMIRLNREAIDHNSKDVNKVELLVKEQQGVINLLQQEINNLKTNQKLLETKIKAVSQDANQTLIGKAINKTYIEYKQSHKSK